MNLQVVLPNLSLSYSSVAFYQLVRVLLTPGVASIDYLLHGTTIRRPEVYSLVVVCAGVSIVSYFGTSNTSESAAISTTMFGATTALLGVVASSLYSVWIRHYQVKLRMTSMQLLLNQAPVAMVSLLYVAPWMDHVPSVTSVKMSTWMLICLVSLVLEYVPCLSSLPLKNEIYPHDMLTHILSFQSGASACLVNLSQFFVVSAAGPVSSTVVGHVKTCSIVTLGWIATGQSSGIEAILGVVMALGGIIV
jgi:solute carrier family 35 protein E3